MRTKLSLFIALALQIGLGACRAHRVSTSTSDVTSTATVETVSRSSRAVNDSVTLSKLSSLHAESVFLADEITFETVTASTCIKVNIKSPRLHVVREKSLISRGERIRAERDTSFATVSCADSLSASSSCSVTDREGPRSWRKARILLVAVIAVVSLTVLLILNRRGRRI